MDNQTIIIRLVLSLVLGAIIGIEREYRNKSAGFRTLVLIALGSCLFTVVSLLFELGTGDRIASNVVTGIGFIGAGVIFKSERGVNGLTTAASIWVTAAIGMSVGAGLYIPAVVTCIIATFFLSVMPHLENWIDRINRESDYTISSRYDAAIIQEYEKLIEKHGLHIISRSRTKSGDIIKSEWKLQGSEKKHEAFIEEMLNNKTVQEFDF